MKIVMITPDSSNPYSTLLVNALRGAGHQVYTEAPYRLRTFVILWLAVYRHGWPDVIHLQWQHPIFVASTFPSAFLKTVSFLAQWAVLRLAGVRFVWTIHNIVDHRQRLRRWELAVCRLWSHCVDAMIVHCDTAVEIVARAYRIRTDKFHVAPLGSYTEWYHAINPGVEKANARTALSLPDHGRVFLFFGLIREYKGVDILLDVFRRFDSPTSHLVLVGKPEPDALGAALLQQASQDARVVTQFDFVDDDRLIQYICAADAVVLPYRDSLTSSTVSLASAYTRPVIAPRLGCMQELPANAGLFYRATEPNGLLHALQQALSSDLVEMGEAARDYDRQFSWAMTAMRTTAVYAAILPDR